MCILYCLRMSDIIKTVAFNIRRERLKKGLTQEALAEKANLHPNYIGLIERQKRNISILALEKIAKALNTKIILLLQ